MKTILCFGDSNTWGFDIDSYEPDTGAVRRMPYELRWPGAMANLLGPAYRVIEDALNARTLMQEDRYFPMRRGLPALEMALDAHAPLDLVILHLGVNELKTMFSLSAGVIALGMDKLAQAAQTSYYGYPAPKVLVIAPPPVPEEIADALFGFQFGPDAARKSREFAALYREIARRRGCAFLDAGTLGFTLNHVDCLHYNPQDHRKLAEAAAAKVRELL
ncbi:MAG TPA: SGNH/GDSL hydrolase family protein [Clostridia bacterium]|nr:SGNH/GDSL hydrolase family protein [Clostridia bacterium]